jgi:transposase
MPDAISRDLRQRVVDACQANEGTQEEIAHRFKVSPSSVGRWLRLKRETGSLEPRPRPGGQYWRKLFDEHLEALESWLSDQPDLTLAELAERLDSEYGVEIDPSQICRVLRKRGWTRKKTLPSIRVKSEPT